MFAKPPRKWTFLAAPAVLLYAALGCSSRSKAPEPDASSDGWTNPVTASDGALLDDEAQGESGPSASNDATVTAGEAGSHVLSDAAGDAGDGAGSESANDSGDSGGDALDGGASDAPVTCSMSTGTWLDPRPWDSCDDTFCQCYGYAPDGGSLQFESAQNENMGIRSLTLPVPMTPGQPYSISVSVVDNGFYGDIEFWGSNAVCGPGLEKLYTQPVQSKVYCADLVASQPFAYLLFVERLFVDSGAPAGEHADTIIACPTVRCAH